MPPTPAHLVAGVLQYLGHAYTQSLADGFQRLKRQIDFTALNLTVVVAMHANFVGNARPRVASSESVGANSVLSGKDEEVAADD